MKNLRSSKTTTTNEEAFYKWFDDFHIEEHPNYQELRDFAFAGWEARLAYMQEQNKSAEQSGPVATIYNGNAYWIGKEPPEGTNLFATPQRQQPLKRLDAEQLEILWMNVVDSLPECSPENAFANAIMDEMERINK